MAEAEAPGGDEVTRPWSQVRALRRNDENGYIHESNVTVVGEDGEERIDLPPAPYTITVTNDCPWTEERVLALLAEVDRLTDLLLDEGYRDGIRLAEAVNEVVGHRLTAERARIRAAVEEEPDFARGIPFIERAAVRRIIDGGEA